MEKYLDASLSPEERTDDLMSKMSVEEKVRQLGNTMVIWMLPNEVQDLTGGIGSVMFLNMDMDHMAQQTYELQKYIIEHSPHGIPALFHGEGLGGPVNLIGGSQFPISIGLAASFEPELAWESADFTRQQYRAFGIRHALSPVADLARDLRWGRCNETYGNDPTLSAEMTVAFVKGMQGDDLRDGVAATGKHFIGYSETEGGLNCHKSMISSHDLREKFAKPFEAAIQLADIKTMMNSYSAIEGRPAGANKKILTGLLREDLGFEGPVISDYGTVSNVVDPYHLTDDITEAGIMCLEAGLDIEAPGRAGYGDGMAEAARSGRLSMDVVDRAVRRVLKLKFELGLFEDPYPQFDRIAKVMDNTESNRKSHEAARKSMTLMKNDGILPLDGTRKILVAGPTANCLRMLFSHYTSVNNLEMLSSLQTQGDTQQGFNITELAAKGTLGADPEAEKTAGADTGKEADYASGGMDALAAIFSDDNQPVKQPPKDALDDTIRQMFPEAKTILEALKDRCADVTFIEGCDYKGDDGSGIDAASEAAKKADVVIACVGGKNGLGVYATTGEGVDSVSLDLPGHQEELLRALYAANDRIVIVHTDARPLCSEWAYEHAAAILEGWLPNQYGGLAIAETLCGENNPAGRTPVDVIRSVGHGPVYHYQDNGSSAAKNRGTMPSGYVDSVAGALRPFGFGLSYTQFFYSDFTAKIDHDGKITASVKVKNIGPADGDEVVQLYGTDCCASMIRPVQELIGFKRIFLKTGEEKTVSFLFNINILSFIGPDDKWIAEKGEFVFRVGGHSDDNRGEEKVFLAATIPVNPNLRDFYAKTEVVG